MTSLQRRITELEDVELEVMEKLEEAQGDQQRLRAALADLDEQIGALTKTRDEKLSELDGVIAETTTEREATAEGLPADLMTLYERLREQKDGVGAAALRARQCGGCRLTLNPADLGVIARAAPDEVVRCEECNRILVRTSESGL